MPLFLFIPSYFIGLLTLFIVLRWVHRKHPKWRTSAAFIVEVGSAYSASFVFDMLLQSAVGNLDFGNVVGPLVIWLSTAIACHYLARHVALSNHILSISYFVVGAVALVAAVVHIYNFFVGLPLLLIGFILLGTNRHFSSTIEGSRMKPPSRGITSNNSHSDWQEMLAGCDFTAARNDMARMFAMARHEAQAKGGEYYYKQEFARVVQPFLDEPSLETAINLLNFFPDLYSFFEMSKPRLPSIEKRM
jgi:hypothetical protein